MSNINNGKIKYFKDCFGVFIEYNSKKYSNK